MKKKKQLAAISVFSGAGGMDIGFRAAGFKVLACVEVDSACCQTLEANMPSYTKILERDIRSVSGEELLKVCGLERGEVDCLFGGPPCQSFSLAGKRQGLEDERGQLVGEFIRLVHEIQPKSFVMENVKGMATWGGGAVLDYIEDRLANPDPARPNAVYAVTHNILNAADYGVPQIRNRIFIVGNRLEKQFVWPKPTHAAVQNGKKRHESVGDALSELPPATPPSVNALRIAGTIKGRRERHGY